MNKHILSRRLRPPDPAESCRKTPEVEAVFRSEICWIF